MKIIEAGKNGSGQGNHKNLTPKSKQGFSLRPTALELKFARQAIKEQERKEEERRALICLAENIALKNTPHDKMKPINKLALELRIQKYEWGQIRNAPEMQKLIRKFHPDYKKWSGADKRKFWAGVSRSVNRVLAQVETLESS